jgi:hypothetical protein
MSTAGKILAVLCAVAVLAFLAVAALDYGQRLAWTSAVFQQELLIGGLPLDNQETDVEGRPVVSVLSKGILQKLFANNGAPVSTQLDAVTQRHAALVQSLDSPAALEEALLPLAQSLGEREELHRQVAQKSIEDLKGPEGPLEAAFRDALTGKDAQGLTLDRQGRKQAIARVLFGTAKPEERQRVMIVVGMAAYVRAVDQQAALLAGMPPALGLRIADERTDWALKHQYLVQRIIALSERIRNLDEMYARQLELRDQRHRALLKSRESDVAELKQLIEDTRKQLSEELAKQSTLESDLFAQTKAVAVTDAQNQQLEREIRSREK